MEAASATEVAPHGGPGFILHLVEIEHLNGEKNLPVLFCPGDVKESFELAGGLDAYRDLDLAAPELGRLTSYAGRDQRNQLCTVKRGMTTRVILICDDSEDHHESQGFIVGLSGQSADWRDKEKDWEIPEDTRVDVGPKSVVPELRCLLAD